MSNHTYHIISLYTDNSELYKLYTNYAKEWHSGYDWGFDLYFPESFSFQRKVLVDLQVVVSVITKYDKIPCPYLIVPRSSISKTSIRMSNSIGIIDQNYNGVKDTLKVSLDNVSEELAKVEKHSRLFQIVLPYVWDIESLSVMFFNDYERFQKFAGVSGDSRGGFGTSGK